MDWQTIISLIIVFITAILLGRNLFKSKKVKNDCSNCALLEMKASIKYVEKKENN